MEQEVVWRKDGKSWWTKEFEKETKVAFYSALQDLEMSLLLGIKPKEYEDGEVNPNNLKFAYCLIDGARKLCHVDNNTMKIYETNMNYECTMKEIDGVFERWCTTFDL